MTLHFNIPDGVDAQAMLALVCEKFRTGNVLFDSAKIEESKGVIELAEGQTYNKRALFEHACGLIDKAEAELKDAA